jgi:hypothetical protein
MSVTRPDPFEAELRVIRRRRQGLIYSGLIVPFIGVAVLIALFTKPLIAFLAIPTLIVFGIWHALRLRWSRCPRCNEYFFGHYSNDDPLDMRQHEDRCHHCGLPLYRPGNDSFV